MVFKQFKSRHKNSIVLVKTMHLQSSGTAVEQVALWTWMTNPLSLAFESANDIAGCRTTK